MERDKDFKQELLVLVHLQELDLLVSDLKKEKDALIEGLLNKRTEERNARAGELSLKANEINAEIVSLLAERKVLVAQVAPRTMAQYDRVRLLKGGTAVASVASGSCLGCNTVVPTKLYNDLLSAQEMQFCPRCHRIAYFKQ